MSALLRRSFRLAGISSWIAMACFAGAPQPADAASFVVSSRFTNRVLRYDADGEFVEVVARKPGVKNPNGIAFGPDGLLYVANGDDPTVRRFDAVSGKFVDVFVADDSATSEDETGGLVSPRGLVFGPGGDLYVCSGGISQILRFDGQTGAFVEVFAESAELEGPVGLAFAPDGDLYVSGAISHRVVRFDGATGEFVSILALDPALENPTGLAFDRRGDLYVANAGSGQVLRYDLETGNSLGAFVIDEELDIPIGVMFHPGKSAELYVAAFGSDSIRRYDGETGSLIDELVAPGSGRLDGAHYLLFEPQPEVACELVRRVITSCSKSGVLRVKVKSDLERGTTLTVENNGTPRWLTIKRKGKGKLKFKGQSGRHGLGILECPGLRRTVDCS